MESLFVSFSFRSPRNFPHPSLSKPSRHAKSKSSRARNLPAGTRRESVVLDRFAVDWAGLAAKSCCPAGLIAVAHRPCRGASPTRRGRTCETQWLWPRRRLPLRFVEPSDLHTHVPDRLFLPVWFGLDLLVVRVIWGSHVPGC
jgi:hypothetical protein